jgi:AcrR family transcriptional regulator
MTAVQASEAVIRRRGQSPKPDEVSHNLQGQRIGRKGRDTRDRIIVAAGELLAEPGDAPFTLSAVARKAGLGMTSLYVYFADLTELLLAVLEPITASAEADFLGHVRQRWPDDSLGEHCKEFVGDYYAFWRKHTRALHLRNTLSEGGSDSRLARQRIETGLPLVRLLTFQMDGNPEDTGSQAYGMAIALFTGIDRLVAVRTAMQWSIPQDTHFNPDLSVQLRSEARLLELAIRDMRSGGG